MKNWLLNTLRTAVILLSATLLITSCQQSDFDEPLLDGETVMVSFNSSIDNQALTRAWDGTNVDKLYFELYVDQSRIERKEFNVTDGNIVNFKIELLKNMTYTAVFWAQKSDCEVYNKEKLNDIRIDYSKISSDFSTISNCDAFHAAFPFTVDQATIENGVDVKLTRPFALIIAGVNDFTSGATSISVSDVATKFNAFNYEASEGESKTFNFTPNGTTNVPGKSHK
ncbi:MAG: hypothetical protein IIX34_02295, partial [Alistipes sp.]|nr:hypothetical protein [Alistipes sp.]